jgi:hypothetical protein
MLSLRRLRRLHVAMTHNLLYFYRTVLKTASGQWRRFGPLSMTSGLPR